MLEPSVASVVTGLVFLAVFIVVEDMLEDDIVEGDIDGEDICEEEMDEDGAIVDVCARAAWPDRLIAKVSAQSGAAIVRCSFEIRLRAVICYLCYQAKQP